jgi:hypothetical protein
MMTAAERVRRGLKIFVGRDFSHDIITAIEERLQPLKYRFPSRRSDAMRPNDANH